MMKRIVIVFVLSMLTMVGCKKPAGPQTTETSDLSAPVRPVSKLMPVESLPETTTTVEPVVDAREPEILVTPTPPPVRTHTVCEGDTLWSVAKKFYGDGRRWKEIAAANGITNESKLPIGKVLRIP